MPTEEQLSDVLSEFARTLVTDFPIQRILDHLVQRIVGVLPIDAAGVALISPGTNPRLVAASSAEALRFEQLQAELGEGPCVEAYETGTAVAVPDLRTEGRFPSFGPRAVDAGLAAVFTFPLRHGDSQLGALDLYRDAPGSLDAGTMTAAQTLADVASAYLLNAQARADLQDGLDRSRQSSLHDPLTGLPNRMLLLEWLHRVLLRSPRAGSLTAVVFIDLDRFKLVNDAHGHRVGDELLVAVAARLTHELRAGDALARLAGDEFVIICEDVAPGSEASQAIGARIGESFKEPFSLSVGDVRTTASIGVTLAGEAGQTPEELLHAADMAMYQAKRSGGACTRIAGGSSAHQGMGVLSSVAHLDVGGMPCVRASEAARLAALEAELAGERHRSRMLATQLLNLADNDPVTGLLNRRGIEGLLEDHLATCRRYGPDGAFLLVGVDGLDDIARTLGHQEADGALAAVAELVAHRLQAPDVAGRWGPAELAVLLPRGSEDAVTAVAAALRGIVRCAGTARVRPGSLVASIGVAQVASARGGSPNQLAAEATKAMLACRRGGGTRVGLDG